MFYYIYRIPLSCTLIITAVAVIFWALIMRLLSRRLLPAVRVINIIFAFVAVGGILYITLHHRLPGERELVLTPFQSFVEAKTQPEMYREMLMNVFLFVPFGLTMPFALLKNALPELSQQRKNVLITLLLALFLSAAIESAQYFFALGRAETDDIICNTLGACVGTVSFILFLFKRKEKHPNG